MTRRAPGPGFRKLSPTLALALLAASSAGAQLIRVPPVRTVATLGACVDASPKIVAITDGATASDCATGAGTYDVTCYCANGAWAASATASGTVTAFSVVTANGVSASVANATTAPAATFTLGAITPSSVAAVGTVTGSNLSGTNTGDQTTITGNAATATALQATLGVSGGGTGATSLTAYAPVCGGTTTTGAVQSCGTGIENVGYVLTTTGATSPPTWQAAAGGGISGLGTTADKVVCTTTSDSAAKACDSSTTLPTQLTTYGADATPMIVRGNAAGSARGSLKIAGDSGDGCQFYGPSSNNSYLICPSAIQISAGANWLLLFPTRTEMGGPLYVKRPHQNSTATSGAPRALTGDTSTPGDSNSIFTNTSASAETHFNLQDAAIGNEGSYVYTFVVTDADGMQINASSGDVINNATTACATSGFIASNTIGSTITLAAVDATNWWVIAIAGTWTCDV